MLQCTFMIYKQKSYNIIIENPTTSYKFAKILQK